MAILTPIQVVLLQTLADDWKAILILLTLPMLLFFAVMTLTNVVRAMRVRWKLSAAASNGLTLPHEKEHTQ